ncbi:MAG: RNA methyltransferase [Ruminococcaceae bacterium]|nr:RNA methyltransferase [Oscillospiraceae bacterium]
MEVITSRKNGNVRIMRELLKSAEYRREHDMFAVEGDHLCGELADCSGIEYFLYTEKAAKKYPGTVNKAAEKAFITAVISEELSEYISDTKSPQGLFAAAERFGTIPENARRLVVLDGVQDPGNVGTMIRAAEAFGTDGIVFWGDCADRFSPKTLRASMGSVFRMPSLYPSDIKSLKHFLREYTVYGAMLDDTARRLGEVKFPEKTAIVIGSEGRGISPEIAEICGEKIYIPIKGAESLNAAMAAAVLLWELSK